ncbi:MAG: putative sulfate exporter family transporter [Sphingobacteriales bacterium]|nr:MAG: putative sulfate exporter family transporter [Sphingobacteriales bacterium]
MEENKNKYGLLQKAVFFIALLLCLTPYIDPPIALLLGFIIAQTTGHPYIQHNSKITGHLLKISVVGLGFGMNLHHALQAGKEGIVLTVFSIGITLLIGWLLGVLLKVDNKISTLISNGTAICGGSAIAAIGPIIKADKDQMSVALGTIFILNSVALFIFPPIGKYLQMSQHQFGLWSAIAIHDTSSVVGAAAKYGKEALQIATTVKLERALWIIPLSILASFVFKEKGSKIKLPYFIGYFVIAMCIATYLPQLKNAYEIIVLIARKGLTVTLFLIGAGLSLKTLKAVGIKPLLQGVLLWLVISVSSIIAILYIG